MNLNLLNIKVSGRAIPAVANRVKSSPFLSVLFTVAAMAILITIAIGHNGSRKKILMLLTPGTGFYDLSAPRALVDFVKNSGRDHPAVKELRQAIATGSPDVENLFPIEYTVEVRPSHHILPRRARVCHSSEFYASRLRLFHNPSGATGKWQAIELLSRLRLEHESCATKPNALVEISFEDFERLRNDENRERIKITANAVVISLYDPYQPLISSDAMEEVQSDQDDGSGSE